MLKRYAWKLKEIFSFYSARDGKSQGMNFAEYHQLLADVQLRNTKETSAIQQFKRSQDKSHLETKQISSDDKKLLIRDNDHKQLSAPEFTENIARLACEEHKSSMGTFSEKLEKFLEFVFCHSKTGSHLRSVFAIPQVCELLERQQESISKLFGKLTSHCSKRKSLEKRAIFIEKEEWDLLCDTFVEMTMRQVDELKTFFKTCQGEAVSATSTSISKMDMNEFTQALTATALYVMPNPFDPIPFKIKNFFERDLQRLLKEI